MWEFNFVASDDCGVNMRLDVFLSEMLPDISRSAASKLICNSFATVNGEESKAGRRLKAGDCVRVLLPPAVPSDVVPEDIPLEILYEDEGLLVVNKPKGMVVHPSAGHTSGTLVSALLHHCKLSRIGGIERPGIVHRIDKDTSGLLVVAKTDKCHIMLSEQLAAHTVTRLYNAIVCGNLSSDRGTIDLPIGRHPIHRKKMAVLPKTNAHARCAVTHFRVLERLGSCTHIEARLETGRTHQIRAHMSHIGHPLLGDIVYGRGGPLQTNGQALHARVLGFTHPIKERYMEFESPLPDYFTGLITALSRGR